VTVIVDQLRYNFMLTGIMGGIDSLMYHRNNQHTQRILHLHVWSVVQTVIQGPPANRAIWQRRFSIFSVSGEGE